MIGRNQWAKMADDGVMVWSMWRRDLSPAGSTIWLQSATRSMVHVGLQIRVVLQDGHFDKKLGHMVTGECTPSPTMWEVVAINGNDTATVKPLLDRSAEGLGGQQ
jgi:hypothetical protein